MSDSKKLFFALCRRLHRLQVERDEAWLDGDEARERRLSRRCKVLTWEILNIELSDPS